MSKHTPGPWFISDVELGETKVYAKALNRPDRIITATLDAYSAERNAKLIAAAPEMAEALRAIAFDETFDSDTQRLIRAIKTARAALAKAGL